MTALTTACCGQPVEKLSAGVALRSALGPPSAQRPALASYTTPRDANTAINLIILSSYANLQEERFLKHADLVRRLAFGERLGSQDERYNTRFMNPVRRSENG